MDHGKFSFSWTGFSDSNWKWKLSMASLCGGVGGVNHLTQNLKSVLHENQTSIKLCRSPREINAPPPNPLLWLGHLEHHEVLDWWKQMRLSQCQHPDMVNLRHYLSDKADDWWSIYFLTSTIRVVQYVARLIVWLIWYYLLDQYVGDHLKSKHFVCHLQQGQSSNFRRK